MKNLLSNDYFKITNGDMIISLNSLAKRSIENKQNVINATVGMLFDEDNQLVCFDLIKNIIQNLDYSKFLSYGSVNGGENFESSLYNWLFVNVDFKNNYYAIIPSMGATGAIYLSLRNYCSKNQEVIISSIRWTNYDSIIKQLGLELKEFNFLSSDDEFDIDSFISCVNDSCKKHHRAYIIINDPCQNPTGYTLSKDEWIEILRFLNDKSIDYPIILLVDIAYIDFSKSSYDEIFSIMNDFLSENLMIQFTFSVSKSLSIYGLRGGALIGMSNSKDDIIEFKKVCEDTSRATWALPNHLTCKIIEQALLTKDNQEGLRKEIESAKQILRKRSEVFLQECELINLVVYPYDDGFFILVPCVNPLEVCNKLILKNIYVVPMCGGLRISLASITLKQIKRLVKEIKAAIKD